MLEGKTILIGKEPGNGRLLIAVKGGGSVKTAAIGNSGCVPDSVSRCKPAEDAAHCKLTIDASGAIILTNLKDRNVTFVNDREIVSKQVTPDNRIALGKDKYSINLSSILELAEKLISQSSTQNQQRQTEVSIKHLKTVWEDYNQQLKAIDKRHKNVGLLARVPMVVTSMGAAIIFAFPEIRSYSIVFTLIALAIMIVGLYLQFTEDPKEKKDRLTLKFQEEYVCPNPECHHFVENRAYNILRQDKKCRYCGCKYSEK